MDRAVYVSPHAPFSPVRSPALAGRLAPLLFILLLSACQAALPERIPPQGHLTRPPPAADIPAIIEPPLETAAPAPVYTVEAEGVAVRELLRALAGDAGLSLDLHPLVQGAVTLHLSDQPLARILHRIARQANLRIELTGSHLIAQPDRPYLRSYHVDYVNLARHSQSSVSVATQIATTGTGAVGGTADKGENTSTTTLVQESRNAFWESLVNNVQGLLGAAGDAAGRVLVNRESALLTVLATDREHDAIAELIGQVLARARQQVLIEATVVEVELSDRYQAGVDWSLLDADSGWRFEQQMLGASLGAPPVATLTIDKGGEHNLLATIRMLERFGNLRVLSSPKLMALNNQTAMLKVVDNRVYFTIDVDIQGATSNSPAITTFESNVHTVPVGFIMAVTPQIAETRQVTLNVRPTITRVLGFVRDPNPALATAGVISEVPEIQVREIESVLTVSSGQIAVLGGLMQDSTNDQRSGVPLLSRAPVIGRLFSYRDQEVRKTELVVFLRPTVVSEAERHPQLEGLADRLPEPTPPRARGQGS